MQTTCEIGCRLHSEDCKDSQTSLFVKDYDTDSVLLKVNGTQIIVIAELLKTAIDNCVNTSEKNIYI